MIRNPGALRFTKRLALILCLLAAFALSFGFYVRAEKAIDRAHEQRLASFLLADELRQSSDDLTRMVRTYVLTGDPVYKQYYQDILAIRDGRRPRPVHYQNIYWDLVIAGRLPPPPASGQATALLDLMRQATFTDAEFRRLADAKAHSDRLTATEFAAMQLAETVGPDQEAALTQARRLLYDDAYHQAKADIMQPLYELNTLINQRTLASVQAAERAAALVRGIFIAFGLSVLVVLWRTWATLRKTLGGSAETVRAQIIRLGQGDFSTVDPVPGSGDHSVIGWLAETRQRLGQLVQAQHAAVERYTRAEQALRESLERYELAIKGTTDGIWHWNVVTGEDFHSPRYQQLLGYAAHELPDTADGFEAIVHPDDLPRVNAAQAAHLERREPYNIELRLRTQQGDYKWFMSRGQAEWDAQGQPLRMSGSITDITEHKRAAAALAKSEFQFRSLFENAPIGLFHSLPEGRFLLVNPALAAMLGYASPEEMVTTVTNIGAQVFVDPAQRPRIMAVILNDDQWFRDEIPLRCKDGRIVIADLAGRRVLNEDGRIAYLEGFVQDITERKHTEKALKESEGRFRNLFENAPVGIFHSVLAGRMLTANPALAKMLGYASPEELVTATSDMNIQLYVDPHIRPQIMDALLKTDGWVHVDQVAWRRKDHRLITVDMTGRKVLNATGAIAYLEGFIEDITERKRAEAALVMAKQEAEAANRAKSVFLANMSHEIRTPLNAILGFAQVLGRDPELNKTQRDSLITIQRSGEHLLTLINDILDMAKIEAGRMTLQAAPFDLPALLAEIDAFFQQRARDRGLVLIVEASELPRRVVGDGHKLRQVLINLVGNAIKFTQAGGVILRVERAAVTIPTPHPSPPPQGGRESAPLPQPGGRESASPLLAGGSWGEGEPIRFSVIDTGAGIAPEEMERLFESFSQTASGRQVQGGTGLGLALSRQFVRLMNGELTVDSTLGQGSCFMFTLRLQPAETEQEPTTRRSGITVVGLVPGQPVCRILIVDDLADNRAPLRALLNALNPQSPVLEFREAADGQEAVAIWEAWQPHLIFMDMRMPVMSGEEATRWIKARMAARSGAVQSLVVALTASAFNENRDYFLAGGCDEFARKPFVAEELFAILEQRAGLRFIRAGETPASAALLLSAEAAATRLAACPDSWQAALKDAVELGDFDRITQLVEQIKDSDAALYEALGQWAYNYDLEAFTMLFRWVKGAN